jgi:hypothetical protein
MKFLALFFVFLSLYSLACGSNLKLRFNDGKLVAEVNTKYTDELQLSVDNIYEVNRTQFEAASIDYDANDFASELNSHGVVIHNQATGFTAEKDTYTFNPNNIQGQFSNGKAIVANISRQNSGDGMFAIGTISATEGDVEITVKSTNSTFILQEGFQKLDFYTEWTTIQTDPTALVVQCSLDWDINEEAFAGGVITGGDIPDVDVTEIKEEGETIGIEVTIGSVLFSVRFPQALVPVGYSATTGGPESPPDNTQLTGVNLSLEYKAGAVDKSEDGSAVLYFIVKADDSNGGVPVPNRVEVDPVVEADSSAHGLLSWVSFFL